ncbi:MAG: hypothetical protein JNN00_18215 [Chitinophagaceae bacterium]|nr:hypothetical protein [Chitinophagaceae bacterium]
MLKPSAVILLSLLSFSCLAQRFGGNPPSVKWKQLNTDTARIIFPAGLDSQAQRTAAVVHYLAAQQPVSLGDKLKKINIVLQNQTIIPNAYVGLGPYRSEFYLTPALNNFDQGTISWNDQLSLHEYRHVQQFNNFYEGLSKTMRILFGEEGYALAINASIPDWFYEGDAVYNETILSKQGRGRVPLFLNAYPSLWQAGKKYSWMKLRNGSFKDYVPNHYYLGYLLVNYGREKYGLDFWSKVTKDAAAFKGLLYPFQKAVKKYAGVDYKTFYNDAFTYYKKLNSDILLNGALLSEKGKLQQQPKQGTEAGKPQNVFEVNKRVVTSYLFPYSISADSLVYVKSSLDKRPAFYIKDQFGEHFLRIKDISIDEQFSYRNGKIVYAAYETDPRWDWRDYSVIRLLDIASSKQQTIRHKTKYFTPDISPSGEKIVAVEIATNGKSEIHVMDVRSGDITMKLRSAEISVFTDPKFIDENTLVCVVRLLDGRSALAIASISSGNLERLTPPSFNVVGYPNVNNGIVYFTASYGGNDDVYALRLHDKKIYKISNGPLGNYFVNVAGGKVTWSAFTAEGYQLQQMEEKDITWTNVNDETVEKIANSFPVSHDNEVQDVLFKVTRRDISVSKYSKGTRLLNFHSWRPYYEDPEFTFSLYGQNVLNTAETELYYLYNQNDNTHAAGFNFIYGALFPYLSAGTQYTFDRSVMVNNRLKQWNQLDSRVGLSIPLSWVRGKSFNNLSFGSSYVYRNDFNKGVNKNFFRDINFSYLSHFISWGQQAQRATQHIFPKIGYNITFNYRHAITKYTSWQPLITGTVYLPGFLPTHSIVLTGAFQETDTLNVLFGNRFPYSRGFNEAYFARMWRTSANYHFPVIYPDWGFANILYLQRVRGNAFYDFTRVYSPDKTATADQRSTGMEVYVDTKWWNQYELTFGFRIAHLLDRDLLNPTGRPAGSNWFEFILPVSIIPR